MSSAYVKVYYGPCDSFDTVAHKPQKLQGLRDLLHKRGFRVDLVQVDYVNYCVFEMCGHEVFRCNIKNLNFNTPFELDPVCQRAIAAIEESAAKLEKARSYLWFWTLIEQDIFRRSEWCPVDTWPSQLSMKSFASCLACIKCCGILCTGNKKPVEDKPKRLH